MIAKNIMMNAPLAMLRIIPQAACTSLPEARPGSIFRKLSAIIAKAASEISAKKLITGQMSQPRSLTAHSGFFSSPPLWPEGVSAEIPERAPLISFSSYFDCSAIHLTYSLELATAPLDGILSLQAFIQLSTCCLHICSAGPPAPPPLFSIHFFRRAS